MSAQLFAWLDPVGPWLVLLVLIGVPLAFLWWLTDGFAGMQSINDPSDRSMQADELEWKVGYSPITGRPSVLLHRNGIAEEIAPD